MFSASRKKIVADYVRMSAGTCLMAVAITSIYDAAGMVVGGFSGLAILLKHLAETYFSWELPLWSTTLVLNIPVFAAGWRIKGTRFMERTAFATVMLSFWLYVLPHWNLALGDYMLASIYGGVLTGTGLALVFYAHGSTGGTDLLAAILQCKFRRWSVAQILQLLDGVIILAGIFWFGWRAGLYAVIAVVITSELTDTILEGTRYARAVFVITNKSREVSQAIMNGIHRGVTGIDAVGMYSGESHRMLYCVVSKKQIVDLKQVIAACDPEAFVIVTDAREVLGEGFLEF
ncbi:MAG: YitT family protein [Roseburia sp.]